MADLIPMLAAVAGQAGEEADDNFNQTVLLLHGDGTNGAQNNTFLDGSTNNFTITRNGNTTQGTFSPFSLAAGEWASYFPTNSFSSGSQRLQSSISTAFGTNNFTVEFWIYLIGTNSVSSVLDMRTGSGTALTIGVGNGQINVAGSINFLPASVSTAVPYHAWTHVAVVRSGTGTDEVTVYINGVSAATGTCADNFTTTSVTLANRYTSSSPNTTNCYLSNFRISNTARSITLPTAPYTSDANTLLLLCQSNRHIDNGPDAQTVTTPDAVKPSITPFSPFAPPAAYDPAVNGGSGYFDGSGDSIQYTGGSSLNFGTGDFTIELWAYLQNTGTFSAFIRPDDTGAFPEFGYNFATGQLKFDARNAAIAAITTTMPTNQWVHAVACRSGTDLRCFINGVQVGSTITNSTNFGSTTGNIKIGGSVTTSHSCLGYISNFRVLNGTALYTSDFTPPTAPLIAITNTSLLCNFTNAGIFDNTGKNNLETVGNAQIDTGTKKYGTGSIEFDGTGDYLAAPRNVDFNFNTSDFTIECWFYIAANSSQNTDGNRRATLCSNLVNSSITGFEFLILGDSSTTGTGLRFTNAVSSTFYNISSATSVSQGTWHHFAAVRSGTTTTLYFNGTSVASGTLGNQNITSSNPLTIGGQNFTNYNHYLNGFIDDLRITKGVARYTANFTVPGKAFPDL